MYKALIFSDLDGTFLHHKTFDFKILVEDLHILEKEKYLFIPISSKTYDEIILIKDKINLNFPFSVENGSCSYFPQTTTNVKNKNIIYHKIRSKTSKSIKYIESILDSKEFNKFKNSFQMIKNLSNKEIMKITNLKKKNIQHFLNREFSISILWTGNKEALKAFQKKLNHNYLDIKFGGKIFNISGFSNKVDGIKIIIKYFKKRSFLNSNFFTIGIGDSENDINMLKYTDYSALIKKSDGKYLKLNDKYIFIKSKKIAPQGWKEVMSQIYKFKEKKNY